MNAERLKQQRYSEGVALPSHHQLYSQLTPTQTSVVQVFALLYEPVSQEIAYECWKAAFLETSDVEPIKTKPFRELVKGLLDIGVLEQRLAKGIHCALVLIDLVVRESLDEGVFEPIAMAIAKTLPIYERYPNGPLNFREELEFVRELRIAIYRQDRREIDALMDDLSHAYWPTTVTFEQVLQSAYTNPFDPAWFNRLSKEFFELGLSTILEDSVRRCTPANEAFSLLSEAYREHPLGSELCLVYAEQLWLRGYLKEASDVLSAVSVAKAEWGRQEALLGAIAFLAGHISDSLIHYRKALKAIGKSQSAQAEWFNHSSAALFFFALLKDGSPTAYQEAEKYVSLLQRQKHHWLKDSMPWLLGVVQTQQGNLSPISDTAAWFGKRNLSNVGLPLLIEIYSCYWLDVSHMSQRFVAELPALCQKALNAGYDWIALEIAELLAVYEHRSPYAEHVIALRDRTNSLPLLGVIQRKAAWELSLNALANLVVEEDSPLADQRSFRLVWRLRFISSTFWALAPIEQKLSPRGRWTKGKAIALKRLATETIDYLTPQDQQICNTLDIEYDDQYYSRYSKPKYAFTSDALLALIGHPLVFWEDTPTVRVEVVAGEPELLVKRLENDCLRLELSPPLDSSDVLGVKETPTRLKVISVNAQHRRIAEVLGTKNRLEVPAQAEERVLQAIASIASLVTVQSDIGGIEAEEVPADPTPHVHLLPAGAGLKVSILIRPFRTGGAYYAPGQGGETVIAEVEGTRLQTLRDLQAEKKNAFAVQKACTVLEQYGQDSGEWLVNETSDCLTLLLQLQELGDQVTVEWPEGEKFKVSKQFGVGDFKINIHRKKDWFEASGELQVSENHVVDLQQLMTLMNASTGPFMPLAEGEFLALTDEFKRRLQSLSRVSDSRSNEVRIHGVAALALEGAINGMEQVRIDQAWQMHIKQIKAACAIAPKVPTTLKATLRDYQREGYVWLSRLAQWGVGACLADDMGLGKTLQGLAIILKRCSKGPTLVIAPTSVCLNWSSEAARFAPSLQIKSFGSDGRQALVDSLGKKDLLVCSYGLLQQTEVAKMLAKVRWQTIVLDEAQAIKNSTTRRSQAVMTLQGHFKIIMTGTPIENHLGELWNLFRFINPGLLGSLNSFNLRFANPIARDNDEAAREALRKLLQPFILRRTKDQVLTELPSRTEITLPIELSPDEMAFYEALRREAIEKLANKDTQAGQKHLQVLAEIMRLRRACCNPALVRPELAISSTKLQQFSDLIEELLDNGHKVLVFSQFVDHLKILRKHLDKQQVSYQYLDGSAPAKKRQKCVEDFQKGEGDVFLISLKAGGTGLNLTAADYVIHMDPWWNPAVEDQASDRAYRIGQQRPVTIYRLVAKGTIEDKIVSLHKLKRDLADSLLTGADMSSKISTEQLLSLIAS